MTDRNELRRLAEDANERGGWYPAGVMWDVLIEALRSQTAKEDAAYIAAASPDVFLGLLDEIEGLSLAAKVAEDHAHEWVEERDQAQDDFHQAMELVRKYAAERDHLRATTEAIANHNPAVTHGWAVHVREMARNALKAR